MPKTQTRVMAMAVIDWYNRVILTSSVELNCMPSKIFVIVCFMTSCQANAITRAKAVVIAVPDKDGPMEQGEDSLRSIVKKALGFELIK